MRNFYEVGKVYVWQNLVMFSSYNGTDCTVVGDIEIYTSSVDNTVQLGQQTDTLFGAELIMARQGFLRPKTPPRGEKSISEMFSKPYVKELDKEKELEEAYE